ncbi:uncharacterized protein LOC110656047 isoform X2 [Hevea brasiliensis]|uniref:uncharacterized protein LOC110656047 isoform X2 n=1 Tax=Hevea brasiliensis TaxID=3981 RepID=UPI000B78B0DF|nr:uncharacterized protein LOC110656047 isoform X2 [Hevea brasiliensis]
MDGSGYRIEAERWLTIAEKLLTARDFQGAKSFAIRARESDPRLLEFSDQIIAIADTLLAGELRIINYNGGGSHDYYAILQLPRLSQSMELVASQYRKLALLLNPTRNRLSFSDHAFRLVSEAWMVFSNPSKKAMYDHELQLSQLGQLGQLGPLGQLGMPGQEFSQGQSSQGNVKRSPRMSRDGRVVVDEDDVAQSESTRSTRLETPHKMTEPIRPIPLHKITEPSRSVPQPVPQPKTTETIRPTPQPVATEPIRPAPQPKAVEPSRPAPQLKASEPARPAAQPVSVDSRTTLSTTQPSATESQVPSFWTACPYCYILYEYPKGYENCAIRCEKCKRAFHAVVIPSPPITGKNTYFCCWGYFPLGFSGHGKGASGFGSNWSPISALFTTPLPGGEKSKQSNPSKRSEPKVIYKDDVYIDLSDTSDDESDSDDDDWDGRRKKAKNAKGKATPSKNVKKSQNERAKKVNVQNVDGGSHVQGEVVGKREGTSGKKKGAKDLGKLDLNVMFSNEVEEAVPGVSEGNGAGNGEEDNIEGIGFFEGLDEFLSSLPILSVVGDDKVKAS